jgi:predicted lysophospholipase L1 biosynthesis ABC-type transport system permease subunit
VQAEQAAPVHLAQQFSPAVTLLVTAQVAAVVEALVKQQPLAVTAVAVLPA